MKALGIVLVLFFVLLSCRPVLRPAYLEGRPAWQKALFWAGPGH